MQRIEARIFQESGNVNQDVVGQTVHWRPPDDWPPTPRKERKEKGKTDPT